MVADERWAVLFSGGKDAYLAMLLAREQGIEVTELVTVASSHGSYLYHVPAIDAVAVIAQAITLDHHRIQLETRLPGDVMSDTAARYEVAPLKAWLEAAATEGLEGIISGVIASQYQYDILENLTEDIGIELVTPLWQTSGTAVLDAIGTNHLEVDIVAVAAEGLDRSWLGRRLDGHTRAELIELSERYGIHPAGEGGEFETLVVDAPGFDRPLRYRATTCWEGNRGHLELTTVSLGEAPIG